MIGQKLRPVSQSKQTDRQMKGQSEIAYLPKFPNINMKLRWYLGKWQSHCYAPHFHFCFMLIRSKMTELQRFWIQGHLVTPRSGKILNRDATLTTVQYRNIMSIGGNGVRQFEKVWPLRFSGGWYVAMFLGEELKSLRVWLIHWLITYFCHQCEWYVL